MNEVKTPKKPLIFYYGIAMVVLLLLNMLVMPLITQHQVEEVDYGTFIKMTENKEIGQVEIEDNQILFTNKDKSKIYKTGLLNDDGLVQRLYNGAGDVENGGEQPAGNAPRPGLGHHALPPLSLIHI